MAKSDVIFVVLLFCLFAYTRADAAILLGGSLVWLWFLDFASGAPERRFVASHYYAQ